ncbi:MAG: hypothetical protein HY886_02100 [Deltaproteobacteria bacterium]|nr:hypothetical protein [Deltaproteobacteria bacterium]
MKRRDIDNRWLFLSSVFCVLLALLAPQRALSEEYKPCGVSLDSLSATSGAPGEVFELRGRWGENQGAKIPAINKGALGRLEVVFWTDKVLTVRIPAGLSPGTYRVGVYCNDMSLGGSYSSGWTNFEVRPSAKSPVATVAPDVVESTQPVKRQRQTVPVQVKEKIRKWPLPDIHPPVWFKANVVMFAVVLGGAVIAVIIIGFFLKHRARPIDPMAEYMAGRHGSPPVGAQPKKTAAGRGGSKRERQSTPASIQGIVEGVPYQAKCLGYTMPDYIPQMTVWIQLDSPVKRRFTITQSDKALSIASDNPRAIGVITTIFKLGAESIDFGHSTNWAAVVMTPGLDVTEALAGQVASKLVELKGLVG